MRTLAVLQMIVVFCLISCQNPEDITNPDDYNIYFRKESLQTDNIRSRIKIWNQFIKEDSLQIVEIKNIASEYTQLFEATAEIVYLKKAEQALLKTLKFGGLRKENILLDLARNYISQHRFKDAKSAAAEAYKIYPNRFSKLVLFDACMELGDFIEAETYLTDKEVINQNDFDFLIRFAKWNDHLGNMSATIRNMEKATLIAEDSKNKKLIKWSYTNLATYYGHAGKIKKSYNYFLKALKIDHSNAFAKKGIAWIIYSYEHNPEEALRIMNIVTETHKVPDYYLFMAEISKFQKNKKDQTLFLKQYKETVKDQRYGTMYNIHNALILSEEYKNFANALQISEVEIAERSIPQIYSLKAYILNLSGRHKEALEIIKKQVVNQTFEPMAMYYTAEVYKSNNLLTELAAIKKELNESSYELGPVISQRILAL
ncbi:lipopolysaccharide assembly protein LapB [Aquimarina sp. RZ0]|uniref:tetratricopeptide repeat protein n=1 Tax=Aquimarina sp. RZ0 TaxID=2607730 RepID=UPI0011F3E4F8|nr:cell surface protein [Aquimarina sp. RZ0]KAA1242861.1 cell surface protein [Aquimarina sp. RZ0]